MGRRQRAKDPEVAAAQQQLDGAVTQMGDTLKKVLHQDETLSGLEEKSNALVAGSQRFQRRATVRKKSSVFKRMGNAIVGFFSYIGKAIMGLFSSSKKANVVPTPLYQNSETYVDTTSGSVPTPSAGVVAEESADHRPRLADTALGSSLNERTEKLGQMEGKAATMAVTAEALVEETTGILFAAIYSNTKGVAAATLESKGKKPGVFRSLTNLVSGTSLNSDKYGTDEAYTETANTLVLAYAQSNGEPEQTMASLRAYAEENALKAKTGYSHCGL